MIAAKEAQNLKNINKEFKRIIELVENEVKESAMNGNDCVKISNVGILRGTESQIRSMVQTKLIELGYEVHMDISSTQYDDSYDWTLYEMGIAWYGNFE